MRSVIFFIFAIFIVYTQGYSIQTESGMKVRHSQLHIDVIKRQDNHFIDKLTSKIRLYSINKFVLSQSPSNCLNEIQSLINIPASYQLELDSNSSFEGNEISYQRFNIFYKNVLIYDSSISCRYVHGRLQQISNRGLFEAKKIIRKPLARNLVVNDLKKEFNAENVRYLDSQYRVSRSKNGYEFELNDIYLVSENYLVSTRKNGKIFEVKSNKTYFESSPGIVEADIYARGYLNGSIRKRMPYLSVAGGDNVVTDWSGEFSAYPDHTYSVEGLSGRFAEVIPKSGPQVSFYSDRSESMYKIIYEQDGSLPSHDDRLLSQPMAYFHVNLVNNFVRRFIQTPWLDSQVLVHTNYPSNCNAFWDGRSINLFNAGGECAHSGLISDVIYHEWAHGLDYNTGGIKDGAYSEALGDITSFLMTDSAVLAPNFFLDGRHVRELESNKIYPTDKGEVHHEGLIYGSTMWDLYKSFKSRYPNDLAKEKLANLIYKTMLMTDYYTEAYEVMLLLDRELSNKNNEEDNYCALNREFSVHGLAEEDQSCRFIEQIRINIDDQDGNGNGVAEPGETVKISITVTNPRAETLTRLASIIKIEQLPGIRLTRSQISFPVIDSNQTVTSNSFAILEIAPQTTCGFRLPISLSFNSEFGYLTENRYIELGYFYGETAQFVINNAVPIPDNGQMEQSFNTNDLGWPSDAKVYRLKTKFSVTHPYSGDIQVDLRTPDLHTRKLTRGLGSDPDIEYDRDLTSTYYGKVAEGQWVFIFKDLGEEDIGQLNQLRFQITPALFRCE